MQKQLLAGVAFSGALLMAISAFAADMPAPVFAEPVAPLAPVATFYDWSGFYVGGHIGWNWEQKKIRYPGFEQVVDVVDEPFILINDPLHLKLDADGFHGGFQAGANWQTGQWVIGAEIDFSWTNADDSKTVPFLFELWWGDEPTDFEGDYPYTFKQDIKWFGTARARIGWAFDNVLIYGTGGFAWKRSEITLTGVFDPDDQDFGHGSAVTASKDGKTHTGLTIGAGAEIGITENLSLKGEWLFMDFSRETYNLHVMVRDFESEPGDLLRVDTPTRVKLTEHVVRVGLNYRFVTAPAPLAPAPAPVKY